MGQVGVRLTEGVVDLQRGHHVLGLGAGQQQGDVGRLERLAAGRLGCRDDGILVDRRHPHQRVDAGRPKGAAPGRRRGGEEQREGG